MSSRDNQTRWQQLTGLLSPLHSQMLSTARRLCRSLSDGDDLYHETVLRAFDKLHTLKDEAQFKAWFYAVLFSVHRSQYRRRFWRRLSPWDAVAEREKAQSNDGADALGTAWQSEERIRRALAVLPAKQREAIVLFELEGCSVREVADLQRATPSAVKSRLSRARRRLRRFYERAGWQRDRGSPDPLPIRKLPQGGTP